MVIDPQFDRQLEEPDVDDLSITDLVHLENQVETALTQTRFRKVFDFPHSSVPLLIHRLAPAVL